MTHWIEKWYCGGVKSAFHGKISLQLVHNQGVERWGKTKKGTIGGSCGKFWNSTSVQVLASFLSACLPVSGRWQGISGRMLSVLHSIVHTMNGDESSSEAYKSVDQMKMCILCDAMLLLPVDLTVPVSILCFLPLRRRRRSHCLRLWTDSPFASIAAAVG